MVQTVDLQVISKTFSAMNRTLTSHAEDREDDIVKLDAQTNNAALTRLEERWREDKTMWQQDMTSVVITILRIEVQSSSNQSNFPNIKITLRSYFSAALL